jgi:hypothetical protein
MRNRAKCKLCGSVIESVKPSDYVNCSCGEIAVDGGTDYYKVAYKRFENLIRLDDDGNEIIPELRQTLTPSKPSRKELLDMLKDMIDNIEKLPPYALSSPVTHSDFVSLMLLLSAIFASEAS